MICCIYIPYILNTQFGLCGPHHSRPPSPTTLPLSHLQLWVVERCCLATQTRRTSTELFYIHGDYFVPSCFKYYWPCSFPYISLHGASTLICSCSEITGAHRRTSLSLSSKIFRRTAALCEALTMLSIEASEASLQEFIISSSMAYK